MESLDSDIRTVIDLHHYFGELKQQAALIANQISAVDRGYFLPHEDEQVHGLLISYWQARSALFDLVLSKRREVEGAARVDERTDASFLLGFAAALILVDAARYLRTVVEHRPVVRRKLNEPLVEFGIPAGTYDAVQRSLLRARHAWHLFHASQYFHANQNRFEAFATNAATFRIVLDIIQSLAQNLDIGFARFSQVKLRTRSEQILRQMQHQTIVRAVYGMQKLVSGMMSGVFIRPGHRPQVPADVAAQIRPLVRTGDVLLVRKEYAVTNYFLPGYWPHVALYLGTTDCLQPLGIHAHPHVVKRWPSICQVGQTEPCVLESLKDGVRLRSWQSPLASDSMVVLRPQLSLDEIATGICRGMVHEGKSYDFDFNFANADRLVCTEVVYRSFENLGTLKFQLVRRAGRPTLSGWDITQMALRQDGFDIVAAYVPAYDKQLAQSDDAIRLVRTALRQTTDVSSAS